MSWIAAAVGGSALLNVGSSLLSSSNSADAARDASQAQLQASREAQQAQLGIFNQVRNDLSPYNTVGQGAVNSLAGYWGLPNSGGGGGGPNGANAFSALTSYPGYQFQYDQGLQALNRNLAAGGRFQSGAMLKDAQTFGQGQAQSSVNNYLDMLKYLGSLGENAGATVGNAGLQTGQGLASSIMSGGTAAASGITGAANAFNQGIGGVNNSIQGALQNQLFSSLFGGGGGGGYAGSGGFASLNPGTGGSYTPGPNGFDPRGFY